MDPAPHTNYYCGAIPTHVPYVINFFVHSTTMDAARACGPPPPEAIYTTLNAAITALHLHAQHNGYALFKRDVKLKRVTFVCDRYGKPVIRETSTHESKRRTGTASKKCNCKMMVALKQDSISGNWELSILEGTHNHESSAAPAAHPTYRTAALDPTVITLIKSLSATGLATAQVLTSIRLQFPGAILVQKDISNIVQRARIEQMGGRTSIQWLLEVCSPLSFVLVY